MEKKTKQNVINYVLLCLCVSLTYYAIEHVLFIVISEHLWTSMGKHRVGCSIEARQDSHGINAQLCPTNHILSVSLGQ